jgi:hypothetical protein
MSTQSTAAVPSDYLTLFDHLFAIRGSDNFEHLLHQQVGLLIAARDPLSLLLIAEQTMLWRRWQVAALLFVHLLIAVSRMRTKDLDPGYDEPTLVHRANTIISLVTRHSARLTSSLDLILHGLRRMRSALRNAGLREPHLSEWLHIAFHRLCYSDRRKQALRVTAAQLQPDNAEIGQRYRSAAGSARAVFIRSLDTLSEHDASVSASRRKRGRNLAWLSISFAVSLALAIYLKDRFSFPGVSMLFLGGNWLGAALIAWPFLLFATWVFALAESRRTRTFHFMSPEHLIANKSIIRGKITSFRDDWFFHIFQFVWLPTLLIAWFLFAEYQALPGVLPQIWKSTPQRVSTLHDFLQSLGPAFWPNCPDAVGFLRKARIVLASDAIGLALASAAAAVSIYRQIYIQRERIRLAKSLYWWDWRVDRPEYVVRLLMIGFISFLAIILLVKVAVISLAASELVGRDTLAVSYFASDGTGGLKFLVGIFRDLLWVVFLFGLYVIVSIYSHWNLAEYRVTDSLLFAIYIAALALMAVPLFALELRLDEAKDAYISGLMNPNQPGSIADAAKYLRDIATLRDWRLSVRFGLFENPQFLLFFQAIVIVAQYTLKEAKLPSLPLPKFLRPAAAKGPSDGG